MFAVFQYVPFSPPLVLPLDPVDPLSHTIIDIHQLLSVFIKGIIPLIIKSVSTEYPPTVTR